MNILHYSQISHFGKVLHFLEIREELLYCKSLNFQLFIWEKFICKLFLEKFYQALQIYPFSGKFWTRKISYRFFATLFSFLENLFSENSSQLRIGYFLFMIIRTTLRILRTLPGRVLNKSWKS